MSKFILGKNKTKNNPIYIVIGLLIVILIALSVYYIFLKYQPVLNFKYEGYAVTGKAITENLLGEVANTESNRNIELAKIEENGTIFKKLNNYFIGNIENGQKMEINLNYPIYINGNSTIYNLSEDTKLLTEDFGEIYGYPNLSVSNGKAYDGYNLERIDEKEYIFIKTNEGIYINLSEIKIKTNLNEYTIPINSIIAFSENEIRYYEVNSSILAFKLIGDIDNNSSVQILNNTYTYENLLINLGILENNEDNSATEVPEEIIQENTTTVNNENTETDKEENKVESNEVQTGETDESATTNPGYVKPEITVEDFTAEVYSAKSYLNIKDPVGKILEAPSFEIYRDGKLYLRRVFSQSGNIEITGLAPETSYEVVAKYRYLNEENQKVENTFYEGSFTTKGYDALGSIELSREDGEIFSNKIQIKNLKITSDLNAEVIKGINRVELETNGVRTVIKNNQVNDLLVGKEVTIESSDGLESNSKIKYKIKFYDKDGIELKVTNNEGETRTAKETPSVKISIKEQDIVSVTLNLKLSNKDNVKLENYKYIIEKPNGEKVKEEKLAENETEIFLNDLNSNQYYNIIVYTDFDINDGKGKQNNVEIGRFVFATQPISTLGSLQLTVENTELTNTTSTITFQIDEERTDARLIQILDELTVNIIKSAEAPNEKNNKEGQVVNTYTLTEEELANLKQAGIKELRYGNLTSNTKYEIQIIGKAELGDTKEEIQVTYNYKEFITKKTAAKVEMKNQFVTGNLIDFDVRIEDKDISVLTEKVRMELRDEENNLIDLQEVETNKEYIRKTYEKLEENKTYKLSFYADQYNEGHTDTEYKINYLLKEVMIVTEPGISGEIGLTELTRKATGKNLVDMSSDTKWYVYPNFNTNDYYGKEYDEETKTLTLGGHSNSRRAVYDLREYAGQEVTISFKAKAVSGSQTAYIQNSKKDANRTQIQGLTTSYKNFAYTVTIDSTGYLGFYIQGGNGINIQELQVELGNKQTSYEEFKYTLQSNYSVSLIDRRDEISSNDYYIKVYENDNLIKEDRYEELPESNILENVVKTYEVNSGNNYRVELNIKINGREYTISELEYNTKDSEEIKGIYNKEDFLEIQEKGHYIVLGDVDLTGGSSNQYRFGNDNLRFEGNIDFNGSKLIKDFKNTTSPVFYRIGNDGIVTNIVLDIYFNNSIEKSAMTSLFQYNYGNITNISTTIKEGTEVPNNSTRILGYINYGTVDKFILNYEVPLYNGTDVVSLIRQNRGTIKNGYIYGEGIRINNNSSVSSNIVYSNEVNGQIRNIFVLSKIKLLDGMSGTVSSMVYTNQNNASIRNVYTVDIDTSIKNLAAGPNIYSNANGNSENIYYFDDRIFTSKYEMKTTKLALRDTVFQSQLLNSDEAFNIDETVARGYYPQLNFPDCMPKQDYIELQEVEDSDLADILSTEVVEQGSSTVKVRFMVNNPAAETITNIKIKNVDCRIESQTYSDGKSEVIAILSNPTLCVSTYSVLGITTKGAFNQSYTREFKDNERLIQVELYKEIRTVSDWLQINRSPTQNYMIMNDIDFINQNDNIRITAALTGKFEGNGYTLKNIDVNTSLLQNIKGELQNLNFENVTITKTSATNVGIIGQADNSKINNINIKNEKILLETNNGATAYAGGLLGYNNASVITNCTVNDIKITINDANSVFQVGGMIGYMTGGVLQNSYVQDLNIKENASLRVMGIGGILGGTNYSGTSKTIENCYAIGNIFTTRGNVGGIAGNAEGGVINRCFTKVNITADQVNVGGIIGELNKNAGGSTTISDCLVLGNIYSTNTAKQDMKRIIGNSNDTSNNYAYENQLINGEISEENLGGKLISYEEILNPNTYQTTIAFNNQYNLSGLSNKILPKLLSSEGSLLPNQEDNILEIQADLEIESIEAQKTGEFNFEARINLINVQDVQITSLTIDGADIEITRNVNQAGKTYIDIRATVTRCLDNYKIASLKYIDQSGETKEANVNGQIELQYYREIASFEDWQNINENGYENYRLVADIDFAGKTNVKNNICINRLETNGQSHTLKNLNLTVNTSYSGLIKEVKTNLQNINFENITIEATETVSYMGVIVISSAENVSSININNLTLNTKGNDVGFIARSIGTTISDITLTGVSITGGTRIGALAGYTFTKNIDNITANDINIRATGTYIGGIIGQIENKQSGHLKNVTISGNTTIETTNRGNSYIGGVLGHKGWNGTFVIQYITVDGIKVKGGSYTGGIGGYMLESTYLTVNNVSVEGISYVGGIQGAQGGLNRCYITNSQVSGTGNYVGGASGSATSTYTDVEIVNTTVTSTGNYVGAAAGEYGTGITTYNVYAKDCTVEGTAYVGGLVGRLTYRTIYRSYNNSKVTATNHTAGGLIGYLNNVNMTAVAYTSAIYQNAVLGAKVKAKSNVGGLIGNIAEDLYMPENYYYSNYIEAYLESEDSFTISLGVGGKKAEDEGLKNTYYYKYSTLNGENPNEENEVFIPTENYLVEEDLKKEDTYTSKLKWTTSYWKYTSLTEGKYPLLNSTNLKQQTGVDLPKDSEHMNDVETNSLGTTEQIGEQPIQTFEYLDKQITTYSNYSVIQDTAGNTVTRNTKLYVKDNNLYAISPDLDVVEENFIIDNYNGKEYETVLGTDGVMYDLKEKIIYPENFKNEDIKSIGNNLNKQEKEVEVVYNNGNKVTFNYQTGEIISEEKLEENKTNLIDYIKDNMNLKENLLTEETNYNATKELVEKLQEVPVSKATEIKQAEAGNVTNQVEAENNGNENINYITTYNAQTKEYEIYNEEELLNTTEEVIETENEKIEKNNLQDFYASEIAKNTEDSGKVTIYVIITIIMVILIVLFKYNINKGKNKSKNK